jgi:hypothetical protein
MAPFERSRTSTNSKSAEIRHRCCQAALSVALTVRSFYWTSGALAEVDPEALAKRPTHRDRREQMARSSATRPMTVTADDSAKDLFKTVAITWEAVLGAGAVRVRRDPDQGSLPPLRYHVLVRALASVHGD